MIAERSIAKPSGAREVSVEYESEKRPATVRCRDLRRPSPGQSSKPVRAFRRRRTSQSSRIRQACSTASSNFSSPIGRSSSRRVSFGSRPGAGRTWPRWWRSSRWPSRWRPTAPAGRTLRTRDRVVLAGLRVALVAVVAVCLFRPVLVVKAAVPQQNFLAVLLDDSRSMQIADHDRTAAGVVRAAGVRRARSRRCSRRCRTSSWCGRSASRRAASRVDAEDDLTFTGAQTRLGAALDGARQELAGLPLAGLVRRQRRRGHGRRRRSASRCWRSSRRACRCSRSASARKRSSRDIQIGRVSTPRVGAQGHDADDRRDHQPDRVLRARPSRSTSRTKAASSARSR